VIISSDLSPPGTLIGRAAETAAIRRAVGQSRIVTVTGLPGVGKTAATIAAAAAAAGGPCPDGKVLIRLDALQDESLLPHTIAAAMRLPDVFDASPLDALITGLDGKRVLIMLDTCEHLLGACAAVAAALRDTSPGVRILATSREPLRVPGEETIAVRPLLDPDAIALFGRLAAAASASPGAATGDPDLVRAVCAKLDGLPLAIGLAARQLGTGSLDALAAGLENGYDFLSDPGAPVPRHRTLQAAIGWSHQMCTPAERLLWARLAVFDTPFCIKDCQEVCATTHLTDETIAIGVTMLAERSVVLREPGEPARFAMPATIRAYGLAMLRRLAEDEHMRRRYAKWRSGPRRDVACYLDRLRDLGTPISAFPRRTVVIRLPLP
jgi:non-specific serine/threonine protein kinase